MPSSTVSPARTPRSSGPGKKKPTDGGRLPSLTSFRVVVDGGDVVSVERVPHAERVGQDPGGKPNVSVC
jgi:hypothetical protein